MSKTEPILITLLRHGSVAGQAHVFRGASDEALNTQGIAQMHCTLKRIADTPFDVIATSPLRRCHDFSAAYAAQNGISLQVLPEFRELEFGVWDGLTPDEAAMRNPVEYQAFCTSYGEHAPPDGESLIQLRARVGRGWHDWITTECGNNRLLVTHAGVMRALLMELFGFTSAQAFQIAIPEAASLRISHLDGQLPFLLSLN